MRTRKPLSTEANTAAHRRWRSKPKVKAHLASYMRTWRRAQKLKAAKERKAQA